MEERLLGLYEIELHHLQAMLQEYRAQNEKIAGRLLIDQDGRCQDPWVQRLLEGFAFLTARIHQRMDDEFPRFTQGLIETLYPDFLCPVPSMGIFEFRPDGGVPELMAGKTEILRGTAIRNKIQGGGDVAPVCEFRTAHDVRMSSLLLGQIRYNTRDLEALRLPDHLKGNTRSAIVLNLRNLAPSPISQVNLNDLDLFVAATGEARTLLTELLMANCFGWVMRDPLRPMTDCQAWSGEPGERGVTLLGLSDQEALLPVDRRTFSGLRLLREYLSLPERLQFYRVKELRAALGKCTGRDAELVLLFDREVPHLARLIDDGDEKSMQSGRPASALKLYCTPAVNLFPKEMMRLSLDQGASELQLVGERFGEMNYEVHRVESVVGIGDHGERTSFRPFFETSDRMAGRVSTQAQAYYTARRSVRGPSLKEKAAGAMRTYPGSDVFLTVVDAVNAPHHPGLRELKIECLCSNRHLPRELPEQIWLHDLVASPSPPYLRGVALLGQVTEPQMAETEGQSAWRFLNHLALNLADFAKPDGSSASGASLREILQLHCPASAISARQQIEGLREVRVEAEIGKLEGNGPPAFVRGLKVTLVIDENSFRGHSATAFGAVIARFLARHAAINSFTTTVLWSQQRKQEIMRWSAQPGGRSIL